MAPRRRSHLPHRARRREGAGTRGRGAEGAAPGAKLVPGECPTPREAAGLAKKSKPRGPGAAAGILAVPAETFPAK